MNHPDLIYRIALTYAKGIGPAKARNFIEHFGSAKAVFDGTYADEGHTSSADEKLTESTLHLLEGLDRSALMQRAEKEMEFISKHNIRALCLGEADYPKWLAEGTDAPAVIFVLGNMQFNRGHMVSIVGTRRPTDIGLQNCSQLVTDLAQMVPDCTIVSGLAYGIDVMAHRTAIEAGLPTIGVLGHGLDRIYPAANRQVAVKMTERGGLLTEYTSQTAIEPGNFLQRNRIIAGLSEVTVVVESRERGGSLSTAATAFSYYRDVKAFPGRVADTNAKGCNTLIKRGRAALIESAADLVEQMGWKTAAPVAQPELVLITDPQELAVVNAFHAAGTDVMHINDLANAIDKSVSTTSVLMFQMELKNMVRPLAGGNYRLLVG